MCMCGQDKEAAGNVAWLRHATTALLGSIGAICRGPGAWLPGDDVLDCATEGRGRQEAATGRPSALYVLGLGAPPCVVHTRRTWRAALGLWFESSLCTINKGDGGWLAQAHGLERKDKIGRQKGFGCRNKEGIGRGEHRKHVNVLPTLAARIRLDFGRKWRLFCSLVTMKLLNHESNAAATKGGAAARRGDTRGSRGFGGLVKESANRTAYSWWRSIPTGCTTKGDRFGLRF